jgi:pimeloyl-ACP methyl ester carboxylesterase
MESLRIHGRPPYHTVVIHGGPGALGEMQPVAIELARTKGTLEPLLSARSIDGQTNELHAHLQNKGTAPFDIIGHSWGAWLGFLYASQHPDLVRRLILVSSGPFDDRYTASIVRTRLSRLSTSETMQLNEYQNVIDSVGENEKNKIFAQIGDILFMADSYHPLPSAMPEIECRYDVFAPVWMEAENLRKTGELLRRGRLIQCPVTAIHGDYDPHPAKGVQKPLGKILKDFKFLLFSNCGHYPWLEVDAREAFYRALADELKPVP